MNTINRNTLKLYAGDAPDEMDTLLRGFFRSEMPHPWPTMKAPVQKTTPRAPKTVSKPWGPARSRLALAASVALLMVGSWFLSALPEYAQAPLEQNQDGTGNANRRGLHFDGPSSKATDKTPSDGDKLPGK